MSSAAAPPDIATPATLVRFWTKVALGDSCWEWTASRVGKMRYGYFSTGSRSYAKAHRWSYEYFFGLIPDGLLVCHHCDNPPCVRPDHLFLGTNSDNMVDASNKGRLLLSSGERHYDARLTESAVREIRRRYANGGITQEELARRYDVTISGINQAINRVTWRHVP